MWLNIEIKNTEICDEILFPNFQPKDIIEKEFPDFHCKLIKNKQKNNSYFAKFETVGHAGFVRAHLDGKNVDGVGIKVQFVCSP